MTDSALPCYVCQSASRVDSSVAATSVNCSRNKGFYVRCSAKSVQQKSRPDAIAAWNALCADQTKPTFYVASRASNAERPAMWRRLREELELKISSTWIDLILTPEKVELDALWSSIVEEIKACDCLVLYVDQSDLPLKGAFVEAGIAIALGKPVRIVASGMPTSQNEIVRALGSWIAHPNVIVFDTVENALTAKMSLPDGIAA